jgi:hypothetical protein
MTIEEEHHTYLGAFFGRAVCDTCRTSVGNRWLEDIHNGYESSGGKELDDREKRTIYNAAKFHDQRHPSHKIRVLFGHASR